MATRPIPIQVGMASDPNRWPIWPQLPLKRTVGEEQQLGRLVDIHFTAEAPEPTVYLGNVLHQFDEEQTIHYFSLAAVFEDGWEID